MERVIKPTLPEKLRRPEDLEQLILLARQEEKDIDGFLFQREKLEERLLDNMSFSGCRFEGCSFQEADMEKSSFTDCIFVSCDFSNCRFRDGAMIRVALDNCKLTGADFSNGYYHHVTMTDCMCRYWNGSKGRFLARFSGCDFKMGFFGDCRIKGEFMDCNLTGVNFSQTLLKGMDMRTNCIDGIIFTQQEVKAMTVNSLQAVELSRRLGIIIQD